MVGTKYDDDDAEEEIDIDEKEEAELAKKHAVRSRCSRSERVRIFWGSGPQKSGVGAPFDSLERARGRIPRRQKLSSPRSHRGPVAVLEI